MVELPVAVLMSTYNGEQFLESQINSILNQDYDNIHLYIRDDGSRDGTINIIKEFCKRDSRVTFINELDICNLGVVRSFMRLLEEIDSELYMFSDQDDVWLPSKISDSVSRIYSMNYKYDPCVVYTNLQVVDSNLKGEKTLLDHDWQDFADLLFTNNAYGCTMLFNKKLKEKINFNNLNYSNIYMHDWWLMLITAAYGEIAYINKPTILYRQHIDNQVGADSKSIASRIRRLLNQKIDRVKLQRSVLLAEEFLREYGDDNSLNPVIKEYIENYGRLPLTSSFINNLKLAVSLPPKSVHPMKQLFYCYILSWYYGDFKNEK